MVSWLVCRRVLQDLHTGTQQMAPISAYLLILDTAPRHPRDLVGDWSTCGSQCSSAWPGPLKWPARLWNSTAGCHVIRLSYHNTNTPYLSLYPTSPIVTVLLPTLSRTSPLPATLGSPWFRKPSDPQVSRGFCSMFRGQPKVTEPNRTQRVDFIFHFPVPCVWTLFGTGKWSL